MMHGSQKLGQKENLFEFKGVENMQGVPFHEINI